MTLRIRKCGLKVHFISIGPIPQSQTYRSSQLTPFLRNRARQTDSEMDMIFHSADPIAFALGVSNNDGEVGMERLCDLVIDKTLPVFCAEDDVNDDV